MRLLLAEDEKALSSALQVILKHNNCCFLLALFWSKKIFRPVADSYDKQKRFITDASHEIKTPLTIIDANTEVIEMMSGESEWTKNTRDQVKRLTSLTNQMVALSRLDENSIRQLISILVDNAMKYAAMDAGVDVFLKRDGRKMCFVLRNLTDGMEAGDQNVLFERFYRPDSSRNSETGGSGIGLSLAKSIVESHKGKITAVCDEKGYITFKIIM